eukprot:TRINITY_DN5913_c0_g1_i1.p1 TRINITY_DN5913_c0_g1~~TRINITY_DN5913_c0_g1_i1.p1  ORF type:complete len:830 (+),score=146.98 TRINITY_DN5913_c0_g1_i1:133-2622(+)
MSKICDAGGKGVIMPFGEYEHEWDKGLRTCIYLVFLLWCFFGVMVVSDAFMAAIEKITSAKRRKFNKETNRYQTLLIWNPTIANLSLVALGSSAPEILLNVVEILKEDFFAGFLGPSTIVGSAAFNLFVIIAVCIIAIPEGEVRYIQNMQVYLVTAIFSVFAYVWLIIILVGFSPNVVDMWEGIMTFLFFPILLGAAFMADRGMFPGTQPLDHSSQIQGMTKEELAERRAHLQKEYGNKITEEQIVKLLKVESQAKSFTLNKIVARRALLGGKPATIEHRPSGLQRAMSAISFGSKKVVPMEVSDVIPDETTACVEFRMIKVATLESVGHVECVVIREGALDHAVSVDYATEEGTAKELTDYDRVSGTLRFEKGETEKVISVKIIDDVAFEEDEEFYINLSNPKVVNKSQTSSVQCVLGTTQRTTVVIIDDDFPGVMCFEKDWVMIPEPAKDEDIIIKVIRKNGSAGKIGCSYSTEDGTAAAGVDYEETSGTLEFLEGEMEKTISVTIKATGRYDRTEMFRVILSEPQAPGKFDEKADGAPDMCILTVMLETDKESKQQVDRMWSSLHHSWEKSKVGHANWAEQFKNAFYVMGGEDDDNEDEASKPGMSDWVFHIITLPWKIIFAFIPPTDYCGGWLCFWVALCMIGALTALIGDLASLFGCCAGIPDEVSAITVVALGTSLPDTFASKSLAAMQKYADDSVGNVTGSNSVNVFLGLGLPWMVASIYWKVTGQTDKWRNTYSADLNSDWLKQSCQDGCFVVKAGTLVFSVIVFGSCAFLTVSILFARRKLCGGELGGPKPQAFASSIALVILWVTYICLSSWYALENRE